VLPSNASTSSGSAPGNREARVSTVSTEDRYSDSGSDVAGTDSENGSGGDDDDQEDMEEDEDEDDVIVTTADAPIQTPVNRDVKLTTPQVSGVFSDDASDAIGDSDIENELENLDPLPPLEFKSHESSEDSCPPTVARTTLVAPQPETARIVTGWPLPIRLVDVDFDTTDDGAWRFVVNGFSETDAARVLEGCPAGSFVIRKSSEDLFLSWIPKSARASSAADVIAREAVLTRKLPTVMENPHGFISIPNSWFDWMMCRKES
jgi:hypothetical protein